MKLIVLKFGGTSVASAEARETAAQRVKEYIDGGLAPVVVVSAMGRKGAPYATDTLLSLIPEDASKRTKDLIMSCGEVISACVFAESLRAAGISAIPMNGAEAGIRTDGSFGSADIVDVYSGRIRENALKGIVPVITGFQGEDVQGDINTLGRGGSDTSAVAIGGFSGACATVIFTDVPGIAKADPRIVPEAEFMPWVGAADMLTLASAGAGVIHPRAVDTAVKLRIPVSVRSTFSDVPGTEIRPKGATEGLVGITSSKDGDDTVITMVVRPMDKAAVTELLPDCEIDGCTVTARVSAGADNGNAGDIIRALYKRFA